MCFRSSGKHQQKEEAQGVKQGITQTPEKSRYLAFGMKFQGKFATSRMVWGNTQYVVFVTQVTVHAGETMTRSILYVVELAPRKTGLVLVVSHHESSQLFSCPALVETAIPALVQKTAQLEWLRL